MYMDKIDYHKTSNMVVSIKEMFCSYCDGIFYELEDNELENCPLCGEEFEFEPSENACDDETYRLIVDHKTGVPSVRLQQIEQIKAHTQRKVREWFEQYRKDYLEAR